MQLVDPEILNVSLSSSFKEFKKEVFNWKVNCKISVSLLVK